MAQTRLRLVTSYGECHELTLAAIPDSLRACEPFRFLEATGSAGSSPVSGNPLVCAELQCRFSGVRLVDPDSSALRSHCGLRAVSGGGVRGTRYPVFLSWGGGMPAELQPFYEASPALLWPLFALSFALVLLLVWSSLAFVLRRLRDTRPGLLLLPLCLPFLWWMIAYACIKPFGWRVFQEYRSVADTLFWVFCLTSFICTCLPARRV